MAVRYRYARAGVILLFVRQGAVFLVERAEICSHDIERRSCVAYQGYLVAAGDNSAELVPAIGSFGELCLYSAYRTFHERLVRA